MNPHYLGVRSALILLILSCFFSHETPAERMDFRNLAGFSPYGSMDGPALSSRFNHLAGLAIDQNGNLIVADAGNQTLRKISPDGVVSTFAGETGVMGANNGTVLSAHFSVPSAVVVDSHGNLFVADQNNYLIRKITPDGVVSTFAGSGVSGVVDGVGKAARFQAISWLAIDSMDTLYVTDNQTVRSITAGTVVKTIAGKAGTTGKVNGVGSAALFNTPTGIAVSSSGVLFVADSGNYAIRQVNPDGSVETFAGKMGLSGTVDGLTNVALFKSPVALAITPSGNLYVGDNYSIREINKEGQVTTVAGLPGTPGIQDGPGTSARFPVIIALASDSAGGLFVACWNNTLRKVGTDYNVTTYAGHVPPAPFSASGDGVGESAQFYWPQGLKVNAGGDVFLADRGTHTIRKITQDRTVTTIAGKYGIIGSVNGVGTNALFNGPGDLAVDANTNVYVADTLNYTIRKITPDGTVSTLAGKARTSGNVNGSLLAARFSYPTGIAIAPDGTLVVADNGANLRRIDLVAGTVAAIPAVVNTAIMVALDESGNIFVTCGDNRIRKVNSTNGVEILAGSGNSGFTDGKGTAAKFFFPWGIAVDHVGSVFVADTANHTIRKILPDGTVSTFAGRPTVNGDNDGVGSLARFDSPWGLAFDLQGNLYVSNYAIQHGAYTIKKGTRAPLQILPQVSNSLLQLRLQYGDATPPSDLSKVEIQRRNVLPTGNDLEWGSLTGGLTLNGDVALWEDAEGLTRASEFYRAVEH